MIEQMMIGVIACGGVFYGLYLVGSLIVRRW